MDPVTIMLWLAEGAVAYVGGRIMSTVIGDAALSETASLIRNAINEINAYTHQAIDENELRKLVASIDAIVKNLEAYSLLSNKHEQLENKFLLEDAIIKTADSISQCKSLGIAAIICLVNSVSLYIIARLAFCMLTETKSGSLLVQEVISDSKNYIQGVLPGFYASLDPAHRLSIPTPPCVWEHGDEGQSDYGKCWLNMDGMKTEVYNGLGPLENSEFQEIVNEKTKYFEEIRSNAQISIISPVESALSKWEEVNQMLVTSINGLP